MSHRFRHREGMALASTLPLLLVTGVLGTVLMNRVMHSARMGSWSRDEMRLQLLADSAVDEMFLTIQETINEPGSPVGSLLRSETNALPGGAITPQAVL